VTTQARFVDALLDPGEAPPPGLRAPRGSVERRFAIYRNNVTVSLVDALAARFPVTQALVGEAFFRAAAARFVRAHPPRSPLLMEYGDGLPAWLDRFEPAAGVPYLGDVARLEAARTRAFHAADAEPIGFATFAGLAPETIGAARLVLHPSLQVLWSRWPIVSLWQAHQPGGPPFGTIALDTAEDAIVVRPVLSVEVAPLPRGGAVFLRALGKRQTVADAAERATAIAGFDLVRCLALIIRCGLAIEIALQGDRA
jgi:hypothetical protein